MLRQSHGNHSDIWSGWVCMGVVQVTSCLSALGLEHHHRGAAGAETDGHSHHADWAVARTVTTPVTRRRRPASSHSQHTAGSESPALTPGRGRAVSRLLDDEPAARPSSSRDDDDDAGHEFGAAPTAAQLHAALKQRLGSRAPIPVSPPVLNPSSVSWIYPLCLERL